MLAPLLRERADEAMNLWAAGHSPGAPART